MDDDNHRHVRLLPWTGADGRRCYLLGDGTGTGVLSRHADRIEAVQLGLADKLLNRARQMLDVLDASAKSHALEPLANQLTLALRDALLIAESRGARLAQGLLPGEVGSVGCGMRHADDPAAANPAGGINGRTGGSDMPQLIGSLLGASADSAADARVLGLLALPGGDLTSASAARRYIQGTARAWGLPSDTVDTLETIAGELAANALEHSHSRSITVALSLATRTVTVSVADEGQGKAAAPKAAGPGQERGRGLLITEALATRWGQRRTGSGLTVWAEVTTGAAPDYLSPNL
jgi:anti-sigma regulatory factor (Ser/Thr protein kinase)